MSDSTRARRGYDASGRRARAAENHARIIDAAAELFLERGYAGTTIPAIAARAEVAVETVYRAAKGKAGLLAAAVQAALAGGAERAELPVEEREGIRRVIDEPDAHRQLRAYAATQPGVWSRVGPLLRVLDEAAPADEELAALQRSHAEQRYHGLRRFASLLAERGALRPDLGEARAADVMWTLCAQSTFEALVTARGWTHHEYREWLGEMLAAALLEKPDRSH
jgi:AcrR family transcriptional regulator